MTATKRAKANGKHKPTSGRYTKARRVRPGSTRARRRDEWALIGPTESTALDELMAELFEAQGW